MRRWLLLAGVLAIAIGTAGYFAADRDNVPSTAQKASVAVAAPRVMALGLVEPVSEILRISAPMGAEAGRIAAIKIREGDEVAAGGVLAVLDTEPFLAAALAQAEATVALKRAALNQKLADLANQEQSLDATLKEQEAERDRLKWDLDKMRRLQKTGVYAKAALTDKQLALAAADQRVESSRLALERNRARGTDGLLVDEALARAELAAAEAACAEAAAAHALAFIRAPRDGRVLRLIGRLGEQIPSDGFAEFGDTDVMMVRAELFESDLRHVSVGLRAEVTSRALDGALRGTVDRIGLKVGRQSVVSEDPAAQMDARVVTVWIRLDAESSRRVAGMTNLQVRVSMPRPEAPRA